MSLFDKILIANRGEIAVRIIRSCKELGIRTVAIYSNVDRRSLHVLMADEAFSLGSPSPEKSYLNIEKILQIAKKADVDAIHPGYGFLSQNPRFVRRCEEEGIAFIGPPARIHEFSGDKLNAKLFLKSKGVPVIPGSSKEVKDVDQALEEAEKLGYPVMIKPRFGGGGVGMKVCHNAEELKDSMRVCLELARSAFGYEALYIEKFYPHAKHIEVQILADSAGNVIHMYERECSIQRRFQKLIEEAPSPSLRDDLRALVTTLALRVAKAIGYVNAGTVEFLYVPNEERFFFMELNSRIQVEHPVTEMLVGVDIVKEQIKIAAGMELELDQSDITANGHAIEARIYAEDPYNRFLPSPGTINCYLPPRGPGIRVDDWVYTGAQISEYYDSLIAKLIVWDRDRSKAIARMRRALEEFVIEGVKTNIPFHMAVMSDERFVSGKYDTRYVDELLLKGLPSSIRRLSLPVAPHERPASQVTPIPNITWKLSGRLLSLEED